MSEWEGSKSSTPTRRTLKGSEYDTDQEWHLRNMRYGDGWAYDSTQSHYKRAKPTYTDPADDRATDITAYRVHVERRMIQGQWQFLLRAGTTPIS